jgi:hypothetical protein
MRTFDVALVLRELTLPPVSDAASPSDVESGPGLRRPARPVPTGLPSPVSDPLRLLLLPLLEPVVGFITDDPIRGERDISREHPGA